MITCTNLELGYNNISIMPAFNLKINKNQWIGIIGKNGTGKSTFLKTILGLIPAISGELTIFNKIPRKCNKLISYIPQEREINLATNMSGADLISITFRGWQYGLIWVNKKLKTKVEELIALVGAIDYAHQPFYTLSGGQKKRIYLAQALINQPQILLLDEPLADLDVDAKHHFIEALSKIQQYQQLGIMIISHDMHEIAQYLDAFIHFNKSKGVHYCPTIDCIKEDVYVGL